jgi:hypothetical protein
MKRFLLCLPLMAVLVFQACKSEKLVSLKFNPPQSKNFEFVMKVQQDIEMDQAGQKVNAANLMEFTYDMLVKYRDANQNTEMISTFKKVRFQSKSGAMEISFDSENPSAANTDMYSTMFSKIFGGIVGKTVTILVNEKGEVVSLKGMNEVVNSMIANAGLDSLPGADQILENFRTQYSDEKFKSTFESMFRILPEKDVAVGDTWDITSRTDLMNTGMELKTKYKLDEINSKHAVVSLSSDINSDTDKVTQPMPGVDMKMNGTQKGTMKIDLATGLPIQSEILQDITANTKSMGMEIPMKIKGTITITSKEK